MNRKHPTIKIRSILPIAIVGIAICGLSVVAQATELLKVETNCVAELTLDSVTTYRNPFVEIELDAVVTQPDGKVLRVPMFWAGGSTNN